MFDLLDVSPHDLIVEDGEERRISIKRSAFQEPAFDDFDGERSEAPDFSAPLVLERSRADDQDPLNAAKFLEQS